MCVLSAAARKSRARGRRARRVLARVWPAFARTASRLWHSSAVPRAFARSFGNRCSMMRLRRCR
eukprot:11213139-Lingulodinium_polyedra.AAC.1